MRSKQVFKINNLPLFTDQLKAWAKEFPTKVWLESSGERPLYSSYDFVLAAGIESEIRSDTKNAFAKLEQYQEKTKDWLFGYFSYDLKNAIENLESSKDDALLFPELFFFQPQKLILLKGNRAEFHYLTKDKKAIETDFKRLLTEDFKHSGRAIFPKTSPKIKMKIFKEEYHKRFLILQEHIQKGDIYEVNFCYEFYVPETEIDPYKTYEKLNSISEAPFSSFLHFDDFYVISASPERYLKRQGGQVLSQPIKGTAKRSEDRVKDLKIKRHLAKDAKEITENIMIVDLVRNDLSKSAEKGSVKVEELCAVYSYKQVHQMISTITSVVGKEKKSVSLIKDTFPMGSMTGAPKIEAMRIIEKIETSKRGVYSGALGYFKPNGDFDFSVVIRSILYNQSKHYSSFTVGSAITASSRAEKEYEECLLKAKAMREVLEN